jgi:hypothetical protein
MELDNATTIWVCMCCMLMHANGECCSDEWHDENNEPWCSIDQSKYHVTMGLVSTEHHEDSQSQGWDECDCETDTYSTSQCDGCGSYLHGERHGFTLWERT